MIDSAVSKTGTVGERTPALGAQIAAVAERWLLLVHQLPADPAYLRVKTLRRLKSLGAVALKNSVYLLPDREGCREDFQWVIREIVAGGGSATLSSATFLEGATDAELRGLCDGDRAREYAELAEAAARALRNAPTKTDLDRLTRALDEIRGRDHFDARGRAAAEAAVRDVEAAVRGGPPDATRAPGAAPSGAVWVTRRGVFVDRMASAWLIGRFIDPAARFRFVAADDPVASEREIPFDMYHGGYTHEGEHCTFETLLACFGLSDPALLPIAEIVHDIDCKDGKFGRPETAGVASVLRGIADEYAADEQRIDRAARVFDALYAGFRSSGPAPRSEP